MPGTEVLHLVAFLSSQGEALDVVFDNSLLAQMSAHPQQLPGPAKMQPVPRLAAGSGCIGGISLYARLHVVSFLQTRYSQGVCKSLN